MSVTVKVLFNDKLFKLPANVNTLAQVNHEMALRYPNKLPKLRYSHQKIVIEDLSKLILAYQKAGINSLKLEAFPIKSSQAIVSEIKIQNEEKEELIYPTRYDMPRQFYVCYNCKGKRIYEDCFLNVQCQVCQGKGEFDNSHKYIKHMKQLFKIFGSGKHTDRKQLCSFVEKDIQSGKLTFGALDKNYEMNIVQMAKIETMEIGKSFTSKFQVHNCGIDLPQEISLVNVNTMENRSVKTIKSGERLLIQIGPFVCQDEKVLQKFYYLCHKVGNKWTRLGYRFGVRVRGTKTQVKHQASKMSFREIDKSYEMNIIQKVRIDKMEVGIPFQYQFEVHNLGVDLPQSVELVDWDTKESRPIKTLKSGEKLVLELGPFTCHDDKLLEKFYYLCYRAGDKWIRLGYKFGLRVKGFKKPEIKQLSVPSRERVRHFKLLCKTVLSQEYLQLKLKQMGIDLNNCLIQGETIIEIIKQIK